MLLDGLYVPLTTPFYPDGRVYLRKLEHNADRYSRTPAAGLVVLSALAEARSLSDEETAEVLSTAAAATAKEKVLIAGIARESVREALRFAEMAAVAGYDAVLLYAPAERMTTAELLGFFRGVADRSPLPLVLESGQHELALDTVAMLASHANVIGMIESREQRVPEILRATATVKRTVTVTPVFAAVTARMLAESAEPKAPAANFISAETLGGTAVAAPPAKPALKTRTKEVGFQVLAGGTENYFAALEAGASGCVPEFAACAPQACHEVLAAWKDGNPWLAAEKFTRIGGAALELGQRGIGAMKFACDLNGYYGGRPRLPLLPPTGLEQDEITKLLAGIRN